MLSQLVFDDDFLLFFKIKHHISKLARIIGSLLLNVKGDIKKFSIHIDEEYYSVLDDEDIAHWILFLSRKGVEDFSIGKTGGEPLKLPTHLFSCLELKHLKLFYCCFNPPASFHGFPNLLSFKSGLLCYESGKFGKFISQCPSLEILNMRYGNFGFVKATMIMNFKRDLCEKNIPPFCVGKVKLVDFAKLANLKLLSMALRNIVKITNSSGILELVGSLPTLQELELDFASCNDDEPTPTVCPSDVDNTTGLLQLQSVDISSFKASENAVCLIKYLLVCTPLLKSIVVRPQYSRFHSRLHSRLQSDERFKFSRKLLKLHRASPIAEIGLY
ncbi:putative leucine-rich repeat domain superfamily [Helianthus annuus]|nr:putative leucine-rich repeat domain superfamily [Helianthus annuus]KAJ0642604.1 putative leucine-rich repeat domain superfamily [Helianthus annuus]KAJ0646480.1 putative leucine-rich repeat domain superfamily [Helianthus annuus]KAJ0823177.1 putative leucine-rich repeat domain superfamily [Helianthus annuus]